MALKKQRYPWMLLLLCGCAAASDPAGCTYAFPPTPSFQTTPVLYGRLLIVTSAAHTRAIDARTCRERWRWDRSNQAIGNPAQRGGALSGEVFLRGTPDGHLVALDARTGRERWVKRIADPAKHETLTMQPAVLDSLVFIGPAGSEDGVRGWIGAYRVRDGATVWRFNTIDSTTPGGGSVWTRFVVDSVAGTLYAAVSNPAPDFAPELRPGRNLYTNSVVALNAHTGALLWHNQLTPNDSHDWDLTQVGPMIGDAIIAAGKDGIVRALDKRTGTTLWSTPISAQSNSTAPVTLSGTHACPGPFGGVLWSGSTYDSRSRLLFTPSVEWCGTFYHEPESPVGGYYIPDSARAGRVTAIDPETGAVRWVYRSTAPMLAGVVVVGDTVITGEMSGAIIGLDATTGRLLFRTPTDPVGGGLLAYTISGTRYLAFPSGSVSAILPQSHAGPARVTIIRR